MDEGERQDLADWMAHNPCKGHQPIPTYSEVGDMLSLYFDPELGYAEPLNPRVTLVRAFSDKRVVGIKVFGVAKLVTAALWSCERRSGD